VAKEAVQDEEPNDGPASEDEIVDEVLVEDDGTAAAAPAAGDGTDSVVDGLDDGDAHDMVDGHDDAAATTTSAAHFGDEDDGLGDDDDDDEVNEVLAANPIVPTPPPADAAAASDPSPKKSSSKFVSRIPRRVPEPGQREPEQSEHNDPEHERKDPERDRKYVPEPKHDESGVVDDIAAAPPAGPAGSDADAASPEPVWGQDEPIESPSRQAAGDDGDVFGNDGFGAPAAGRSPSSSQDFDAFGDAGADDMYSPSTNTAAGAVDNGWGEPDNGAVPIRDMHPAAEDDIVDEVADVVVADDVADVVGDEVAEDVVGGGEENDTSGGGEVAAKEAQPPATAEPNPPSYTPSDSSAGAGGYTPSFADPDAASEPRGRKPMPLAPFGRRKKKW
jgi:hypothetical protein